MTTSTARLAAALADRYAVEREIGAGGMATVLLARDIRHDRKVAIKVLRDDVAKRTGAERFLREIRTTANLQHPHIVPLFDSGEADGSVFYVMPFIDGETLRDRLEREGQLPVADAVRIAREVADALDYAHRHGVVHRDVKPENVLLHDNRALVADFGIALALARSTADPRLTDTGMSVGTPHYMSPEQAMGEKHITARTDIFALGAMLYEMLAGEPPFTGESAQVIVAKMMTTAPTPIVALRPTVPEYVAAAIDGALQRVAADRFASAALLSDALSPDRTASPASVRTTAPAQPQSRPRNPLLVGGLSLAAGAAISAFALRAVSASDASRAPVARAVIPLARDQLLSIDAYPLTISRDGTHIVYAGDDSGRVQLSVRALADTVSHVLPGTEGASTPFFSPDGSWIGFFAHGKLKKVQLSGGAPIDIAGVPPGEIGADWGTNGTILYALANGSLHRTREDGSAASVVVIAPRDSARRASLGPIRWPSLLPGDTRALVTSDSGVGVLDLASGDIRTVVRGQQGRYLPTGHLLFNDNEGRVRVVGFDQKSGEMTGASVPVFEAYKGSGGGAVYFAVSQNGTLVYMPGGFQRTLVRVDRYGRETPINAEPRGYRYPTVSPDGRRIAVTVDPRPSAIWIVDPALGQAVPVTPSGEHSIYAVWSWDGTRIAFNTFPKAGRAVMTMLAQPGAEQHIAFRADAEHRSTYAAVRAWTRSDDMIGYVNDSRFGELHADIVRFHIGDSTTVPLVASSADERGPALSPDGRWIAYSSDISGAREVYVRPSSGVGATVMVSVRGGVEPQWSASGKELFFRAGTRMMTVSVRNIPDFAVLSAPQILFSGPFDFSQEDNWSASPDGSFIMIKADPQLGRQLRVVFNWFDELTQIGRK